MGSDSCKQLLYEYCKFMYLVLVDPTVHVTHQRRHPRNSERRRIHRVVLAIARRAGCYSREKCESVL